MWWAGSGDSTEFEVGWQWRQEALGDQWELGSGLQFRERSR